MVSRPAVGTFLAPPARAGKCPQIARNQIGRRTLCRRSEEAKGGKWGGLQGVQGVRGDQEGARSQNPGGQGLGACSKCSRNERRCSNRFGCLTGQGFFFSCFTGLMLWGRSLGPFHSQYLALAHVERVPNP